MAEVDYDLIQKDLDAIKEAGGNDEDATRYLQKYGIEVPQETSQKPTMEEFGQGVKQAGQGVANVAGQTGLGALQGLLDTYKLGGQGGVLQAAGQANPGLQALGALMNPQGASPIAQPMAQAIAPPVQGQNMAQFQEGVSGELAQTSPAQGILQNIGRGVGYIAPGMVGGAEAEGAIVKGMGKVAKWEGALQQAEKAQGALDQVGTMLGKAKELAVKKVGNLKTNISLEGTPAQVLEKIKDPMYGIQFNAKGEIVQNVGNMDKVAQAFADTMTSKDWVDATKLVKQKTLGAYRQVRTGMKKVTGGVDGDLSKALGDYHDFKMNEGLIRSRIEDARGNAMGKKLADTFKIFGEEAYKQAFNDMGKVSPEIKSIANSMRNRNILANLLKGGGAAALGTGAIKGLISH